MTDVLKQFGVHGPQDAQESAFDPEAQKTRNAAVMDTPVGEKEEEESGSASMKTQARRVGGDKTKKVRHWRNVQACKACRTHSHLSWSVHEWAASHFKIFTIGLTPPSCAGKADFRDAAHEGT